jgi:hypothetical protein
MADILSSLSAPQTARAALRFGNRVSLDSQINVTPLGLLAIGGLVSAILLSIPPIIRAAGKAARRRERADHTAEGAGGGVRECYEAGAIGTTPAMGRKQPIG